MPSFTVQALAERVSGAVRGDGGLTVTGVSDLRRARPGDLSFIGEAKYADRWETCAAGAALVSEGVDLEPGEGRALILVKDADVAMARVLDLFALPDPTVQAGIHPTAIVDASAKLGKDLAIGPWCVIGPGVTLGDGVVLHAGVSVYEEARIGAKSVLWPGVVVRERCVVGERCLFHSHVVIGTDGFGYRPEKTDAGVTLVKVPHLGHVEIGKDVELGAGTTIDRGKFGPTIVGDGCKLDNQVQIGHNCTLGRMVVIAGCTGVAGSTTIGDGTMIGGLVAIGDHRTIGKGVQLAGGAQVMHDIPDGQRWAGSPAKPLKQAAREELAIQRLPDLLKQLKKYLPEA